MGTISIRTEGHETAVLLSHRFIDEHMPEANGEFVKVYLYLLRSFSRTPASFSLSRAADLLNCTERDILRALKYWAKANLLDLTLDDEDNIEEVTLLPVPEREEKKTYQRRKTEGAGNRTVEDVGSRTVEEVGGRTIEKAGSRTIPDTGAQTPSQTGSREDFGKGDKVTQTAAEKPEPTQITRQKREELSEMEEIQQLLFLAEKYLGRTLTTGNVDKILYFYDGLKFSTDLIEYLIEYCVSKGHQSMRYIETVALAWAEQGVRTVEDARKESSRFQADYYAIMKAMGISGRNPIETEIRYMDLWKNKYGFSLEIITEACSRTVLQTGQQSFPYADRILSDWNRSGVHSMQDIEKLDLAHQRKKSKGGAARGQQGNRFNNFNQRSYDFQEYEKRLLEQN